MFCRIRWLVGLLVVAGTILGAESAPPSVAAPPPVAGLAEAGKPGVDAPGHKPAGDGPAAAPLSPRYRRVEVAPTRTSIYIGSVSLTLPPLERYQGEFTTTYEAKVFPFSFYNETGRLWIVFSDEQLRRLEQGERVAFQGRARRADGVEHRVEGHVTPADVTSGKVKVRVFATMSVELIFNPTYHFTGE